MMKNLKASLKEFKNIRSLTTVSLLMAVSVILSAFTIQLTPYLVITFSSVPCGMAGYLFGPFLTGAAAVIVDILKYIVRPLGPFFIGFTINELITGLIYGFCFYKKEVSIVRVIVARLLIVILINLFLTPLWLSMLYGEAFIVLVSVRIVKNIVMFPVDCIILYSALKLSKEIYARLSIKK